MSFIEEKIQDFLFSGEEMKLTQAGGELDGEIEIGFTVKVNVRVKAQITRCEPISDPLDRGFDIFGIPKFQIIEGGKHSGIMNIVSIETTKPVNAVLYEE